MAVKRRRRQGSGRLVTVFSLLLGLLFLGCGVGMGILTIRTVVIYYQARHWTEVPARILHVELKRHSGGGGTTYQVVATYEYEFNGSTYRGSRVGLSSGSDNIGTWQEDTYRRLAARSGEGQTVPCYVDPAHPEKALLDRNLRYEQTVFQMVFVTMFGAIELVLSVVGGQAWLAGRHLRRASKLHPDEPWLHDPDWASGLLRPRTLKQKLLVVWLVATYWSVVSLPQIFIFVPALPSMEGKVALGVLVYPVVALLILADAIRTTLLYRKFGRSYLQLETIPGVIGGHLRGTLVLVGGIEALDHIDVSLKCTRQVGVSVFTRIVTVWEDKQTSDTATAFGRTEIRVPLEFAIPRTFENAEADDEPLDWRLRACSPLPGINLALDFKVPVFVTPASDSEPDEQERPACPPSRVRHG